MNLYEILEVNENCTEIDIKKAYHRLAKLYHPDKNQNDKSCDKFQDIQNAYEILSNQNSRINYCKLNKIKQNNFVNLLHKIFKNDLIFEELKCFDIKLDKKDWHYLENNFKSLFEALNFQELLVFFQQGKFPKKKIDTTPLNTETDETDVYDAYDSYFILPIYYHKNNKLNINLNLDISLNDLIENNKKKIKIKRTVNTDTITSEFIFNLTKPYVIFNNCGDICNDEYGTLIIKLNLPKNFYWVDNLIIIEHQISLYDMIYGLNIDLPIEDEIFKIPYWVPCRDGFLIEINYIKIKTFNLTIKLILNYNHSEEKKKI